MSSTGEERQQNLISHRVEMVERGAEGENAARYFDQLRPEHLCFHRANKTMAGKREFIKDLQSAAQAFDYRRADPDVSVFHFENTAVAALPVRAKRRGEKKERLFRNIRIDSRENATPPWRLGMSFNSEVA